MGIIGWIVAGLIIGAIAKLLMPGNDPGGIILAILLGIVGAVLGGAIGRGMGLYGPQEPAGWLMSIVGAIIVLFIYREDYYLAAKQPGDDDPELAAWQEKMARAYGLAEVIVAKNRHGGTGKERLKFEGRFTKFSDLADEDRLPEAR